MFLSGHKFNYLGSSSLLNFNDLAESVVLSMIWPKMVKYYLEFFFLRNSLIAPACMWYRFALHKSFLYFGKSQSEGAILVQLKKVLHKNVSKITEFNISS